MIRFTTDNGKPSCIAELDDRVGVYLDNFSVSDFAKDETGLRQRLVAAIRRRGTLLFSFANAFEVSSADTVRSFLDDIGPEWVPLAGNPWKVVEREEAGFGSRAPVSENFIESYFLERASELSPEGSGPLDLSAETFFSLGTIATWAQAYRSANPDRTDVDDALSGLIDEKRADLKANPHSLDQSLPPIAFDHQRPATFVLRHLLRGLVKENGFQFKKNDGWDLCHAVLAAAYAQIFTLDKQWKRRVELLPMPHQLAVYYRPEALQFVEKLEALVG
jgi:hypothetical protein